MAGAAWYRYGSVTVVQGSPVVVGVATTFLSQVHIGDAFTLDGSKFYEIESIEDDTHLTLHDNFAEVGASNATYGILRNFNTTTNAALAAQLTALLASWQAREDEFRVWRNGVTTGGASDVNGTGAVFTAGLVSNVVGGAGYYPLADATGQRVWLKCPAALAILSADSDKVDGFHASAAAEANKLLALNAESKLPASITGDAATVGGFTPSQTAAANQFPVVKADNSTALPGDLSMAGRLVGGFGASSTTGGVPDWNDASNTIAGFGRVMLKGNDLNGPNALAQWYHVMNLNYGAAKDGSSTITQFAIPYNGSAIYMYMRCRYTGAWTSWMQFIGQAPSGVIVLPAGLTFPATQVASSDPNTLDDYEEGTFTPTAIGSTIAGSGTYSTQAGSYTKKGREVTVLGSLTVTAHTGTGLLRLTGLPFSPSGIAPPVLFRAYDVTLSAGNVLQGYVLGATLYLEQVPSGGGTVAGVNMDAAFTATFMVTYFV